MIYGALFLWAAILTIILSTGIYSVKWGSYISKDTKTMNKNIEYKTAYFAGGCFWCMEGIFESQEGVAAAISWYIGGTQESANYKQVSNGGSRHREAVKVEYDPDTISYEKLVELYWTQIDPTDAGWQFADRGFHYTTAIYYSNDQEKNIAETSKKALEDSGKFDNKIATEILVKVDFYPAESYHQDYYKKSSLRYNLYKKWSGRADFIDENWKDRIAQLNEQTYSDEALKKRLTPLQYHVTQEEGTERAFQNEYWDNKEEGIYVDIIDGTPLYSSLDKFDSGTGWPSFTKAISEDVIDTHTDTRFFMTRTEARSASSDAHLGHIFPDAPQELGGIRHCINSAALRFVAVEDLEEEWYEKYLELFE